MPDHDRILTFRILILRDTAAFGEFYRICQAEIYRFILARIGSHEVAEDLTSEVFLKACQYLFEEKRDIAHLRGFLFSVARTSVIDHFRRAGGHEQLFSPDDPFFLRVADEKIVAEGNEAETKFEWNRIRQELKQLRREYAEIIFLRYFDGLSMEEISVVLGKSAGAVRVLLHRAQKTLEHQLKEKNFES